MSRADAERMTEIAKEVAGAAANDTARDTIHSFDQSFARGADLAWEVNADGQPVAVGVNSNFKFNANRPQRQPNPPPELPALVRQMPGGAELWEYGGKILSGGPRESRRIDYLLAGPQSFPTIFRTAFRKSRRKRRLTSSSASSCAPTRRKCW